MLVKNCACAMRIYSFLYALAGYEVHCVPHLVKCSTLVSRGFKIITLSRAEAIAESTFPLIEKTDKIAVRAIGKGLPDVQDMVYNNRKVKAITVYDKVYGQYMD